MTDNKVYGTSTNTPRLLGQIVNLGSMPTSLPGRFTVIPGRIWYPETEGASWTFTPKVGRMYVAVFGQNLPTVGDYLICELPGSRWVADSNGECPNWTITVNSICGGHIAGATVTLGGWTRTTNASGQATFPSAARGMSGTVTAPGFCTYNNTFTVPTDCSNLVVNLYPTTVSLRLTPTACGGTPNAVCAVSVTVTQTAGGSFSGSCSVPPGSSCTMSIPAPCPGSGQTYTYSVSWSCPHLTGGTTTVTLVSTLPGWTCFPTSTFNLTSPAGEFSDCINDCFGPAPASITATFTGFFSGTYTLANVGIPCNLGYLYDDGTTQITYSLNGALGVTSSAGGALTSMSYDILVSGTPECPIACVLQQQSSPPLGPPVPGSFVTLS